MKPFYVRELTEYPTGRRRRMLILMAVLANLIANYESSLAQVLPSILVDLDISKSTYGMLGAFAVLFAGASAGVGGWLSDRVGRVPILIPTLALTAACNYLMLFVNSVWHLLAVRVLMLSIEGAAIIITAALIRDFAPRVGRATTFGFWLWGPVGATILAGGITGLTLDLFVNWRYQFVITGTLSLILTAVIALGISDVSPSLRNRVVTTEAAMGEVKQAALRELLRYPHIWIHMIGNALAQVLFWTATIYGAVFLVEQFGFSNATAALIGGSMGLAVVFMVLLSGWLSDRWQIRKPFVLAGTGLGSVAIVYFLSIFDSRPSPVHVALVSIAIALCIGIAFVPWMANFSENAEDIAPNLQGAAMGIWGLLIRLMIVVLLVVCPLVVERVSWSAWWIVVLACQLAFIPAIFFFKGPWRRPAPTAEYEAVLRT